jgi:hypothetical protein
MPKLPLCHFLTERVISKKSQYKNCGEKKKSVMFSLTQSYNILIFVEIWVAW